MKKGLVVIGVFGAVALAAGLTLGLASLGFVQIAGISPKKYGKPIPPSASPVGGLLFTLDNPFKKAVMAINAGAKEQASQPPPPKPPPAAPKTQPGAGYAKLAEVWNSLEPKALVSITAKWQPSALAPVLMKMDPDEVSTYLGLLKPDRADAISRAIQIEASKPPSEPTDDSSAA